MVATDLSTLTQRLRAIGPFNPIQIAPTQSDHELLSNPASAGGPVAPLAYHGGRTVQGAARVQVIFMDGYSDDRADFAAFAQALVQNGYYVSPDGKDATNGAFLGFVQVASTGSGSSGLPQSVKTSQLEAWLDGAAGHGSFAPPDPNTLYALVMGAGSTVSFDTGGSSCSDFCGYHSKTPAGNYYAVICDPGCDGCHGGFTPAQGRQMVMSHEYGEWRSDPDGDAWYNDPSGMENGDECAWQLVPWGPQLQWAVQPLAQNGQGCGNVPPYQATVTTPAPQPAPQPPPHDWQPQHGLPLTPYFTALLADQSLLDPGSPAGALLAHVLSHPSQYAPGGDMATLLGWLQANPTLVRPAVDSPPLGSGWGAYLDRQGVA